MMPEVVRELAAGGSVGVATLFEFRFRSSTRRYWDGLRMLTTGGREWEGAGAVIGVSGIEHNSGMAASQVTFSLAGTTPELIAAALVSESEVSGHPCAVYVQFMSARQTPLDSPVTVWAGTMDQMIFKADVKNQSISLTAETLFVRRARAPHGYMTDVDQRTRYPGDRGLEFMPTLKNKQVSWLRG